MHSLIMPKANVKFSKGHLPELFIDSWHWSVHLSGASGTQPAQAKQTLLSFPLAQNLDKLRYINN